MPIDVQKARRIREQREALYGNIHENHIHTGILLAAFLGSRLKEPIERLPGHVVALLNCVLKIERAMRPTAFHEDNYIDAFNYLEAAFDLASGTKEESSDADNSQIDHDNPIPA